MAAQQRKSFYPLESNPEVFNELIQLLGVSSDLAFEDIYSLDDPELLPHPALALVLVLPEGPLIKAYAADAADPSYSNEYSGCGADEPVVWFKQTIYNACGLYALLHALSNGEASNHLGKLVMTKRSCERAQPLTARLPRTGWALGAPAIKEYQFTTR